VQGVLTVRKITLLRIVLIHIKIQCMIICICNNINDRRIAQAAAQGHDTLEALQFELGVAGCCGKCESAAREVLAKCKGCHHAPQTSLADRIEHALRPAMLQPA
jgi:bacterioferritin-associated ferredoxin